MRVKDNGYEKVHSCICENCHSELEWTQKDIYETYVEQYTGQFIVCPICKTRLLVRLK